MQVLLLFFFGLTTLLQNYLDQKDYFRLKTTLEQTTSLLPVTDRAYFEAFVDNAFGHVETSRDLVSGLLDNPHLSLTEKQQFRLWILRGNNYYKLGQYRLARQTCDTLLTRYKNLIDDSEDLLNNRLLWGALESVPPMEVRLPADTPSSIPWKRDAGGLINVPVRKDTSTYDFVFDTGAGLSTISESFAHQLRLRLDTAEVDVQSSTGIHNRSTLAVADSLYLGGILLKNVVFLVLPDARLSFPQIHYAIHAILGMPVICQLEEVHLYRSGTMRITPSGSPRPSNLALDGWTPVLSVGVAGDTLSFFLDTGANTSELLSPFFQKYTRQIIAAGQPTISSRGGAGGVVKTEVYRLKDFPLVVGGQRVTLPGVDALAHAARDEKYYGSIGQDVIGQFREMTLDFKYMYVAFLP